MGSLYTASSISRRTFILKAERVNMTGNDLALMSKVTLGVDSSRQILANEDLSGDNSILEYVL